jgi:hypothetical protein
MLLTRDSQQVALRAKNGFGGIFTHRVKSGVDSVAFALSSKR